MLDINDDDSDIFKDILKAGEKAFKHLLKNGGYKVEDLEQKPYQNLINETNKVFQTVIQDNVISPVLRSALQSDAFLFGSLKTHAQLFEANTLLINKDGQIKSQAQLEHELNKLNVTYNNNYLEAERQFAVSSAISADRWTKINDRYNLQYRTVNDNKVRDEHRVLHDITLPVQDDFWKQYYPPNGWRCRCVAVQVRKSKYPETDSAKAMELGDKATMQIGKDGKNRLEIFRFNPGASLKLMPPEHPYNKVEGAEKVKEALTDFRFTPENIQKLKDNGFKFDVTNDRGFEVFDEHFSKFNIMELNSQMDELAKKNDLNFNNRSISVQHNGISINYFDTKNEATVIRKLYFDDLKIVKHEYFELPEHLQGKGFSKEMFQLWHNQYLAAGLDKIKVHANLDIGGYTWAKYGFKPFKELEMSQIKLRAKKALRLKDITDDEYSDFLTIAERSEDGLINLNKVANTPYGKKILLGTSWNGELDLRDKLAKSIYEKYLFGK